MSNSIHISAGDAGSALQANVVDFFSRCGRVPRGRFDMTPEEIRISSGVAFPLFNWVLQARFSDSDADHHIEATIQYFRDQELPFVWGIFPGDRPEDLPERLAARGFAVERAPAMAINLDPLPPSVSPPGLVIEPVRTNEDSGLFARTLNAGDFQASPEIEQAIPSLLQPSFSTVEGEPHLRCFVGYQNGVPVATSARFLCDGVVGIYGVATVPEARRRGFGAAMTLAALEDGRALGYRVGVLLATSMGEPVHRRLGFRELYRVPQFEVRAQTGAI